MNLTADWKQTNFQVFWAEIALRNHLIQIYENERVFIETLEGFAGSGFIAGDCIIIIAQRLHLDVLSHRLLDQGFDLERLTSSGRYIAIDAEKTLAAISDGKRIKRRPLQTLMNHYFRIARKDGRKVRVFGEMVALLFQNGQHKLAMQLEQIWDQLIEYSDFSLFCAYPQDLVHSGSGSSFESARNVHVTQVGGWSKPSTEVYYRKLI